MTGENDPKIVRLSPILWERRQKQRGELSRVWEGIVVSCERIGGEDFALSLATNAYTQTLDFVVAASVVRQDMKVRAPESIKGWHIKVTEDMDAVSDMVAARRVKRLHISQQP
jgi:hypothetical protein